MNMQMLFTFYHMVLFQVITRGRAFPLINMKGWSENTGYQETPGVAREKYDHTDTRVLKSISSRSINIHVDGYYGLMEIVSRLGWRMGSVPRSFKTERIHLKQIFSVWWNLKVQNLQRRGVIFYLNDIG